MSTLVLQAASGGQISLVGANTASTYTITVPAVTGNLITSGDTATVTSTMLAASLSLTTPNLGTPSAGTLTNCTGLPIATGVSGLGSGVATALGTAVNTVGGAVTVDGTATLTNKTLTNPSVNNYTEGVVAIGNTGTSQTLSLTSGTFQTATLTGNCTFTMPTATAGKSFILILTQDSTGGRTATFTSVKWPGGAAPTITTTATTGRDILTFVSDGTNWYGTIAQAFA